jgi:glyoxylase I family protein
MRTLGFHHAAVQVRDVERVAAFYRDVIGLAEVRRHQHPDGRLRSIWLALGTSDGAFLAIEEMQGPPRGPLGWSMVALRIEAVERQATTEYLARHGCPLTKSTAFSLYVSDPEGNEVAFSHYPTPAP